MRGIKPASASGTTAKTLEAVAMGFPAPPADAQLTDRELVYWDRIMHARMPQQWVDFDLMHAVSLARAWADIEVTRELLLIDGDLIEVGNSWQVNPRHRVIELLSKRAMSLTRLLQLHAVATIGHAPEHEAAKAEASRVARALGTKDDDEDDFLARPLRH